MGAEKSSVGGGDVARVQVGRRAANRDPVAGRHVGQLQRGPEGADVPDVLELEGLVARGAPEQVADVSREEGHVGAQLAEARVLGARVQRQVHVVAPLGHQLEAGHRADAVAEVLVAGGHPRGPLVGGLEVHIAAEVHPQRIADAGRGLVGHVGHHAHPVELVGGEPLPVALHEERVLEALGEAQVPREPGDHHLAGGGPGEQPGGHGSMITIL